MITAQMVKEPERTGRNDGLQKALEATQGDIEKAIDELRTKGLAKVAKKASRVASEGTITLIYTVGPDRVLVEVNCETDFVAKTDEFKQLVYNIAMQIAASNPQYVRREDVPEAVQEHEKEVLRAQALEEGKPEKLWPRWWKAASKSFSKKIVF